MENKKNNLEYYLSLPKKVRRANLLAYMLIDMMSTNGRSLNISYIREMWLLDKCGDVHHLNKDVLDDLFILVTKSGLIDTIYKLVDEWGKIASDKRSLSYRKSMENKMNYEKELAELKKKYNIK